MANKKFKPLKRYRPTRASLEFAKRVVESQGLDFDPDQVIEEAETLYESLFADLLRVLELEHDPDRFHSGRYHLARAYAAADESGLPVVVLDMVFEFWVSGLALLNTVLGFSAPDRRERARIAETATSLFELFGHSERYDKVRMQLAPFYVDYPDCVNLGEGIGRAMTVFVLCHELAHIELGHLEQQPEKSQELEADKLATEYFLKAIAFGRRDRDTRVHIDPKIACTPMVLSRILDLYEAWCIRTGSASLSDHHPSAMERHAVIAPLIEPMLEEHALEVLKGMTGGISDLRDDLGLS